MGKRKPANAEEFIKSGIENSIEATAAYMRLFGMAIARFEWGGVPDGCNMEYFERALICNGCATIFREGAIDKYLSLGVVENGGLNVYGEPSSYNAITANGRQFRTLYPENAPLCWNNLKHTPDLPIIINYATKLWHYERAAEVNTRQQKFASIIKSSESQRLTMENIMLKYQGNQPFIWADKSLDLSGIEAMNLNIPFVADKILAIRNACYSDAMADLGIINFSSDKRERLTAVETFGELGSTELVQISALRARQQFCEKFNTINGTHLSVKLSSKITIDRMVDNGNLYNDSQGIE